VDRTSPPVRGVVMLRFSWLLFAACEIRPAPPKQAAPPPPPPAAPADAAMAAEPQGLGADAGIDAVPAIQISAECLEVGVKLATVFIDSAGDPAQRSIAEQERSNVTRRTGEACTTGRWSENARKCYLATKTPADIKKCETRFTPPPPQPPPPPPGAGPQ
jgi:hypothetical protein